MAPLTLALVLSLARERPAFLDRVEGDRAVLLQKFSVLKQHLGHVQL